MIKSNKGIVEIEGTTTDILADYSALTKALVENAKIDKEELRHAFERSFMTNEELLLSVLEKLLELSKEQESGADE